MEGGDGLVTYQRIKINGPRSTDRGQRARGKGGKASGEERVLELGLIYLAARRGSAADDKSARVLMSGLARV